MTTRAKQKDDSELLGELVFWPLLFLVMNVVTFGLAILLKFISVYF